MFPFVVHFVCLMDLLFFVDILNFGSSCLDLIFGSCVHWIFCSRKSFVGSWFLDFELGNLYVDLLLLDGVLGPCFFKKHCVFEYLFSDLEFWDINLWMLLLNVFDFRSSLFLDLVFGYWFLDLNLGISFWDVDFWKLLCCWISFLGPWVLDLDLWVSGRICCFSHCFVLGVFLMLIFGSRSSDPCCGSSNTFVLDMFLSLYLDFCFWVLLFI